MIKKYQTRVTSLAVFQEGETLFSEMTTTVSIDDEAAGEFVVVEQVGRTDIGKIAINPEEWPALRSAINRMVKQCGDLPELLRGAA